MTPTEIIGCKIFFSGFIGLLLFLLISPVGDAIPPVEKFKGTNEEGFYTIFIIFLFIWLFVSVISILSGTIMAIWF